MELKLAVIGSPVEHSLSPVFQNIFAENYGIQIDYRKIKVDENTLSDYVKYFIAENFVGFNCTFPLKTEINKYLAYKSKDVEILNSCNTVKIGKNDFYGYTTDGYGIAESIKRNGIKIENSDILILGASGTARSAIYSLLEENVKSLTVLNRSDSGLNNLKHIFKEDIIYDNLTVKNLHKYCINKNIIINATTLGMKGFDEHEDFTFLRKVDKNCIIYDAVYNPIETRLLKEASKFNLPVINGLWMLILQGSKSFEIWTGKKISDDVIQKAFEVIVSPPHAL